MVVPFNRPKGNEALVLPHHIAHEALKFPAAQNGGEAAGISAIGCPFKCGVMGCLHAQVFGLET
ncbi:hypothetical protein D5I55_08020 [Chakrabartia godavariana]|nr:hypothetical protein D5I55_08020 [Chakrabartia godavariana]